MTSLPIILYRIKIIYKKIFVLADNLFLNYCHNWALINNEALMELRLDEVLKMTGLSIDTVYRKEKNDMFPKRFKIDRWHVRWHERAIKEWMRQNSK